MKTRIGIRREDKNPWEKRTPLIPSHVKEISQKHPIEFWIQPSPLRIFRDEDYRQANGKIEEDISLCPIVFAVKEIPLHFFKENKVYLFFSHTIKGQPYNMPMLKKMVELRCTLIDYERIVDEKGQRLVFFGLQAGQAGMIDTLWALGKRLECEGWKTAFSSIKQALDYSSLVEAKEEIERTGRQIRNEGLNPGLVPLVCGFAGYGRVSRGAQEIFDLLPYEEISPENLKSFFKEKNYSAHRVYKVVFKEEHMVRPKSPEHIFELQDYYNNPDEYEPVFESYVPYLTILVNGIYWAPQYPRLVTKDFLKKLWQKKIKPRLKVIGDISCDIEGAIECTVKATDPAKPVFLYDSVRKKAVDGIKGRGVAVMAVDNLPAELPLESSLFFSEALKPLVSGVAKADFTKGFAECGLPKPLEKAVILYKGKLTPDYESMKKYIS